MAIGLRMNNNENARSVNIAKRQNVLIKEIRKTVPAGYDTPRSAIARSARKILATRHNATVNPSLNISKPRPGGYK